MCGIAGIIDVRDYPKRTLSSEHLIKMTDAISHRGPDAGSLHIEPGIALGHRRLSIIDVASGQQPMSNEDDTVWVVFNGEIYNHAQTRTELEKLGHRFKTVGSDTEVILHAWEQWGTDAIHHFRGMFAFVLWDRNQRKVWIARDRLGVKPLFYGITQTGLLLFGSELKALTAHPHAQRSINQFAVEDYLSLGYVPEPKTIFKEFHKLAAAHELVIDLNKSHTSTESLGRPSRYWRAPFGESRKTTPEQAVEELDALLKESVKLRLISEVPLGAFLSGGVDSSIVVATMAEVSDTSVQTCTVGFEDKLYDESPYAKIVADQYKTIHSEFKVVGAEEGLFHKLYSLYDEPFADSSAIPTYRVCELARQRVTVALSGDGGDETFGGYRRYRFQLAEDKLRGLIPSALRKPIFGPLAYLYPRITTGPQFIRAKSTLQGLSRSSLEAYFHSVSVMPSEIRQSIRAKSQSSKLKDYSSFSVFTDAAQGGPDDPFEQIQDVDYQTYLSGGINVKVDRASMAHSLEVREPLMDHKIVEWAARLDRSMHIDISNGKKLLKDLARKKVPAELIDRKKQGFSVPIDEWLRGSIGKSLQKNINHSSVTEFIDQKRLSKLLDEHISGSENNGRVLWSIAVLDQFLNDGK